MRNPYDSIGRIGLLLAIVGAVNWLLVGLFQWNFVQWLFTSSATQTAGTSERIVYVVVGVGGILAIPMLAATLARSRSRDVEYEERDRINGDRDLDADFYAGAPKNDREADRSRPSRFGEPDTIRAQESPAAREQESRTGPEREERPMRRTERVIYRTEEPIDAPSDATVSPTDDPAQTTDASLRYGTVEETDEGMDEGMDEQHRAA